MASFTYQGLYNHKVMPFRLKNIEVIHLGLVNDSSHILLLKTWRPMWMI